MFNDFQGLLMILKCFFYDLSTSMNKLLVKAAPQTMWDPYFFIFVYFQAFQHTES